MKKKRALAASRIPDDYAVQSHPGGYVIQDASQAVAEKIKQHFGVEK